MSYPNISCNIRINRGRNENLLESSIKKKNYKKEEDTARQMSKTNIKCEKKMYV